MPKWRDSRISFKHVFITRRPDNVRHRALNSSGHPVAAGYDLSNHPSYHGTGDEEDEGPVDHSNDDQNYTMFDLSVDSIDVTLSFARWFEGKGLVEDAVIKGVRGVLGMRIQLPRSCRDAHLLRAQIAARSAGTQTTPRIQRRSGTSLSQATSSSTRCS